MNSPATFAITRDDLNALRTTLPSFFALKTALKRAENNKRLGDFYHFIFSKSGSSHSQLFQDLFVAFVLGEKKGGRFLEFGATNGVELSNSLLLEQHYGWTGVLAEPDPQWQQALKENRKSAAIITDCIYSKTGQKLEFLSSAHGVLSSLKDFAENDKDGMSGNTAARLSKYDTVMVETLSLNDVCEQHFSDGLDYMSVDTEGSEYEILASFDFDRCRPTVMTVEHNFSSAQQQLDKLMNKRGYARIFRHQSEFDAWYVSRDAAKTAGLI